MDSKQTDWDEVFLTVAMAMAGTSRCVSRQVGAIIVKNNHIIASGVNNTPGAAKKCDEIFPARTSPEFDRNAHHHFSERNEIHAEMDAIGSLLKNGGGADLGNATLYTTLQPCDNCLKHMAHYGIKRIVFAEEYDLCSYSEFMLDVLKQFGIELVHKQIVQTPVIDRTMSEMHRIQNMRKQTQNLKSDLNKAK